jgi:hypothetical protein
MRKILFGMMIFTSLGQAMALTLNVSDFNFEYKNPHGEGNAAAFSRSSKSQSGAQVVVDRIDKDFKFVVTGDENQDFEFKNAPSVMTEADAMTVTGLNLNISEQVDMSLHSARFTGKDDILKLDGLSLNCQRQPNSTQVLDQFILGCIQKLNFRLGKYSSQQVLKSLEDVLQEATGINHSQRGNLSVSSISLRVTNGKYELSADVKAQVSGKITSKGSVGFDTVSGVLTLKISEVKVAFLNITSKVFDELKKSENEKMKVREPFVYFTIR